MKQLYSIILLIAGPLCYLYKLPYMFNAWCYSPMDRWDWAAIPAALAAAAIALRNTSGRRMPRSLSAVRVIPLVVFLVLFAAAQTVSVNSFAVLSGAGVWWSCCFAALSPVCAFALLPAFLLLCLGCTSSTYWIGYLLSIPTDFVILLKCASAAAVLMLAIMRIRIKLEITAFTVCFIAGMIFWHNADTLSRTSAALLLDIERPADNCIVRELPADESSARFFRRSAIRCFSIADDDDVYHLLEISDVRDIHEVHPASHCLLSSGREIISEEIAELRIDGRTIPVTLIFTGSRSGRELFAVWYSDQCGSCSRFLAFRRHWSSDGQWRIYQFSIVVKDSLSEAICKLEAMIGRFAAPAQIPDLSFGV